MASNIHTCTFSAAVSSRLRRASPLLGVIAIVSACGGTSSNFQSAGTATTAGTTATGGANTGGYENVTDTSHAGAADGGAPSSGGTQNVSGTVSDGGATSSFSSRTSGGTAGVGGSDALAGMKATGGSERGGASSVVSSKPTGGAYTGGTRNSGGGLGTGGAKGSGGTRATGGTSPTGGISANAGSRANGGTSTTIGSDRDRCGRPSGFEVPSGYSKLAWHDEFDVDGAPSSSNWNYETGFVRNNELQWYQSKNAAVSDGQLVITGKRERVSNPNYSAGSSDWKKSRQYAEYTSTSMSTSGKQSWKFGRFEMCAKIPVSNGMWPAWWTLGVSGEWPSNGEIDIMEYYKGKILANVACGTSTQWTAKWDSSTRAVDANWAASYHLWRMDWNSTQIDLYVDDTLMNSVTLSSMLNADGKSPFLQEAYMLVNLAIGGDNGGDPTNTSFPQEYLIDYLRVYQ